MSLLAALIRPVDFSDAHNACMDVRTAPALASLGSEAKATLSSPRLASKVMEWEWQESVLHRTQPSPRGRASYKSKNPFDQV